MTTFLKPAVERLSLSSSLNKRLWHKVKFIHFGNYSLPTLPSDSNAKPKFMWETKIENLHDFNWFLDNEW